MTAWTIQRTVGPSFLPVTVPQLKAHLRLDPEDRSHDALLTQQIMAATEQLERDTDRVWAEATYTQSLSGFPRWGQAIQLALQPVTLLNSISYLDPQGESVEMPVEDYRLDSGRRQVHPAASLSAWPDAATDPLAVSISFQAGYGDVQAGVPNMAKEAILLQASKWFRDPAQEDNDVIRLAASYERIVKRLVRSSYP